jgi:hypothetical protein
MTAAGRRHTTASAERLRIGRKIPNWTAALDWVALADEVPPASHSLYVKLRMYLNEDRGDGIVWPGMERLAEMMGFEKIESVGRWLKPLVEVGAIEVIKVGMPARNEYVLHDLPPEGYAGPMTLRDWTRLHKAAIDSRIEVSRGRTRLSRDRQAFYLHPTPPPGYDGPLSVEEWAGQHLAEVARRRDVADKRAAAAVVKVAKAQVSLDTPQNGLQAGPGPGAAPVPPQNGLHVPPQNGGHVPPQNGLELPVVELDLVELDASSSVPAAPGTGGPGPEEEGNPLRGENPTPRLEAVPDEAVELLTAVQTAAGLPAARHVRGADRARLVGKITERLAAGWPPAIVVAALSDPLTADRGRVRSVPATLTWRIDNRLAGDPPPPAAPPRPDCPTCTNSRRVLVEVDGRDVAAPCPDCAPVRVAA